MTTAPAAPAFRNEYARTRIPNPLAGNNWQTPLFQGGICPAAYGQKHTSKRTKAPMRSIPLPDFKVLDGIQ